MRDQHMNPGESVQAFIDSGAEFALAHHHGTFQLTDEPIEAPLLALADALANTQFQPNASASYDPERYGSCDRWYPADICARVVP